MTKSPTFLNTEEAANFLGLSPGTLTVWRCTRRVDLPFYKLGGLVRYDVNDLLAYVNSCRVQPDPESVETR